MFNASAEAGPVLVMERSAWEATVVWTGALVLLLVFGSPVVALTEAEFERVAPWAGAVTEIVMVEVVLAARLAVVQVTVAVPLQLQPVPLALTNVTPAGSVSLTLTVDAVSGPALLIFSV